MWQQGGVDIMTCTLCKSEKIHHTYSSGQTVCKECFNFFQATVNQMMGIQ